MTKIIAGTAGLITTLALVSAAAFAQFATTVTATNATFSTGTAALEVRYPTPAGAWNSSGLFDLATASNGFGKFTPGAAKNAVFGIRNRGDVPLDLNLRLTAAPSGDWAGLKDVMQLRIYEAATVPSDDTGYATFSAWNAVEGTNLGITLQPVLADSNGTDMVVEVRLDPGATNASAGKTVTTEWVLTGTQPAPAI